jgi:hypothetical protein
VIDGRSRPLNTTRHSGFNVGERLLYKEPGWSFDVPVEFRGADGRDALVIFPARSHSQVVPIDWLRRGVLNRA